MTATHVSTNSPTVSSDTRHAHSRLDSGFKRIARSSIKIYTTVWALEAEDLAQEMRLHAWLVVGDRPAPIHWRAAIRKSTDICRHEVSRHNAFRLERSMIRHVAQNKQDKLKDMVQDLIADTVVDVEQAVSSKLWLEEARAALTDGQRRIFDFLLEGGSKAEAAEEFNVERSAITQMVQRMATTLKKQGLADF